jgi:hypothetical protein
MNGRIYRFSGHETFPCRYAWLPKGVQAIRDDELIFSDMDKAIVLMGLGKNMVKALRFWVTAMKIAEPKPDIRYGLQVSEFGEKIFGTKRKKGYDPYLEDISTLWLLHWQLCAHDDEPIFAWEFLVSRFQEAEIRKSNVVPVMEREALQLNRPLSPVTLAQHFDVFLHSYVPTRGRKSEIAEDSLDCPLTELELIQYIGKRETSDEKSEPAYAFRREPKPEISPSLFAFCLNDFWNRGRTSASGIPLKDIATSAGSPGQVFKLPEDDIRERLFAIEKDTGGYFKFSDSSMIEQVTRNSDMDVDFLRNVYEGGLLNV